LNSNKKLDFIISGAIIVAFIVLVVVVLFNLINSTIGLTKDNFTIISIFIIIISVIIYLGFSKTLFEPLFESDEQIKDLIKETIHELNTPVSTIQINTKILKKTQTNEKDIERLNRIEKACKNLLNIYDQMEYKLKKEIRANTAEIFNINDVLLEILNDISDIKKDIKIQNFVDSEIDIKCDKNGFIKSISNIISNAIKYNKPNGFIKIYFENSILTIEDSGIGINEDTLFKVFDKYFQENKDQKGFGLGLSIIKEFCDNSNIKININSKIEQGTKVSLNLSKILV
jgi:two-component system OmpR family sensor kinase